MILPPKDRDDIAVSADSLEGDILRLRDLYRQEMNCQIVHDAHHVRGFTRLYRITRGGRVAGYGSVGDYDTQGREVVTEFYLTPEHRAAALPLFRALLVATGATQVRAQTNDRLLTLMLFDVCRADSLTSDTLLFEDAGATALPAPEGITFRRVAVEEPDSSLQHRREDVVAEASDGREVGKAGFLSHYNPPYGDVYMEVNEDFRGRGIGSYLVQEAKRACYEAGRRPAARCNVGNVVSRRTLQRAGFLPCARILRGTVDLERA